MDANLINLHQKYRPRVEFALMGPGFNLPGMSHLLVPEINRFL
jgi:hypothetical protein